MVHHHLSYKTFLPDIVVVILRINTTLQSTIAFKAVEMLHLDQW